MKVSVEQRRKLAAKRRVRTEKRASRPRVCAAEDMILSRRRALTHLADRHECLRDDGAQALGDIVMLREPGTDELGFCGETFEKE